LSFVVRVVVVVDGQIGADAEARGGALELGGASLGSGRAGLKSLQRLSSLGGLCLGGLALRHDLPEAVIRPRVGRAARGALDVGGVNGGGRGGRGWGRGGLPLGCRDARRHDQY
jgi:hypothetical protein